MEHLFELISGFQPGILLSLLICLAALEYLFPPVPGDTAMLFASTLAGARVLPPTTTFLIMVAGSCLGGLIAYYLGKKIGRPILNSILFKYLGHKHQNRAEHVFRNHATWVLCGNRFLPGIRGIMLPLAGILSNPFRNTIVFMTFSNIAWCSLIFFVGFWFGGNWQTTQKVFQSYNYILALAFSVIIFIRLWSYFRSCSR